MQFIVVEQPGDIGIDVVFRNQLFGKTGGEFGSGILRA
jgi:hypothetical protein